MYSLLMGELPKKLCGHEIAWKYRDMIEVEIIIFNDESPQDKLNKALNKFYCQDIPKDRNRAIEEMLWFFECGSSKKDNNKKSGSKNARRAYDFNVDAPYIYAAFREQYGINLMIEQNLHWWEFSALFDCLNEETKMKRIIYYRTADTKGLPDKQRKFINAMRARYEIRKPTGSLSDEARLAKRNADMKEYVEKRLSECSQTKENACCV